MDEEAVESWLEGDDTDPESRGLLHALTDFWAEGESYGGAVLIPVLDDGLHPSEPVDPTKIARVRSWEVLDRYAVYPHRSSGRRSPVDYWIVSNADDALDSSYQIVHPSRVAAHRGLWMPGRWMANNNGWGLSRLELLRDQRDTLSIGLAHLGRLLDRASQDVVVFAELSEMVEDGGLAYLVGKLAELRAARSSEGLMCLDGGIEANSSAASAGRSPDKFEAVSRNLSGADSIAQLQHEDWRRGSAMPAVIADGEVSGGLNSGEDAGAWRSWDSSVEAEFRRSMLRPLTWGLGLLFASREGPTQGRIPEDWKTKREPIAEPDPEVEARTAEIWARVDAILEAMGAVTDMEVRKWRAVDGKHSAIRVESEDIIDDPTEAELAAEQLAAVEAELVLARAGQPPPDQNAPPSPPVPPETNGAA